MNENGVTTLPASPLIEAARRTVEPVLPPVLFDHSLRTFLCGRAWARRKGVAFDEEGLLIACLFHDVGVCEPFRDPHCPFQLNSSRALAALLSERGVERSRIDRLAAAIDHHFQPLPRWRFGPEAGLLHIGSYMDVVGLRRQRVRSAVRTIAARYPPRGTARTLLRLVLRSVGGPSSCIGIFLPDLVSRHRRSVDTLPGVGDD